MRTLQLIEIQTLNGGISNALVGSTIILGITGLYLHWFHPNQNNQVFYPTVVTPIPTEAIFVDYPSFDNWPLGDMNDGK